MSEADEGADGSVSQWLDRLRGGDSQAAGVVWDRYFQRLAGLARSRMRGGGADAEDVALSAIHSLCRGAEAGRFPWTHDRDDLWKLLFVITVRKVSREAERAGRLKRGGSRIVDEGAAGIVGLESALSEEPSPETVALLEERCAHLLESLQDDLLRRIAMLKLEGFTNEEIADELGRSVRTVERKLELIRSCWEDSAG